VPQDRALYADLTAVENLHFVGRLQGPTTRADRRHRARANRRNARRRPS
jgi:ABC-type multidrug transport system ATPase subunit